MASISLFFETQVQKEVNVESGSKNYVNNLVKSQAWILWWELLIFCKLNFCKACPSASINTTTFSFWKSFCLSTRICPFQQTVSFLLIFFFSPPQEKERTTDIQTQLRQGNAYLCLVGFQTSIRNDKQAQTASRTEKIWALSYIFSQILEMLTQLN